MSGESTSSESTCSESMDEDELCTKPPSRLLELPPEVLQTTMYHMDPETFYISLLSCKTLFQMAKSSRRNLLCQLSRLLGLKLGLDTISLDELFLRFRRRAAESLCGASVRANVYKHQGLPSLATAIFSPGSSHLAVASTEGGPTISIYKLTKDDVKREVELHLPEYQRRQVVKMAFSRSSDLAVLCRSASETLESILPEDGVSPTLIMYLVVFHYLYAEQKGYFYSDFAMEVREIAHFNDVEPVGLAMAKEGLVGITWVKRASPMPQNHVVLYARSHEPMKTCAYGKDFDIPMFRCSTSRYFDFDTSQSSSF